jgi:drug/metabolite transporter (DMT)-like permease
MTATQRTGILLITLSAVGYAFMPILTKSAYDAGVAPLDLLTWRFIFAAPAVWLIVLLTRQRAADAATAREARVPVVKMLLLGALFALASLMAFLALQNLLASTYTVLLYTYPAVVALILLVLGEPLSRRGWFALALTLIGVALTVPDLTTVFGGEGVWMLFAMANGALYAVYIVISGRVLRGKPAMLYASALSISGSLIAMLIVSLFNGLRPAPSASIWLIFVAIALICTVLTNVCFYAGLQRVGAGQAAILSTLEPVFVLILAFSLLGDRLLPIQLAGAALILASVVLLQLPGRR